MQVKAAAEPRSSVCDLGMTSENRPTPWSSAPSEHFSEAGAGVPLRELIGPSRLRLNDFPPDATVHRT